MADPRIRRVREADVPAVAGLVHELAAYERLADQCEMTADRLRDALFAPVPTVFAHVADVGGGTRTNAGHADGVTGQGADSGIVGFALWFVNYSTFRGAHGIFLEDLYVRPEWRGHGLGRALLAELAAECVRRGYTHLEWSVLDWNTPSIGFYTSLGATPMDEWTAFRLADTALAALGGDASAATRGAEP